MKKTNNELVKILKVEKKNKSYLVTSTIGEVTCSEDDIVNYRLMKDKVYTIDEYQKIIQDVKLNQYYLKCLNFYSYRIRSKKEFIDYLVKFNLTTEETNQIINKLTINHYINEELFAETFYKKYYNNGKGSIYIKNQLLAKGISNSLIEKTKLKFSSYNVEVITDLVNKLTVKYHTYPVIIQKQKIHANLLSKGLTNLEASQIINNLVLTSDSELRLEKEISKLKKKYDDQKIIMKLLNKGYSLKDIKEHL